MRLTHIVAGAAVTGGLAASALGLGAATAGADPAWAPPKPVDPTWAAGNKQVWDEGWNHWGVWVNNVFIPTY
jgi:hypothetical protein